MHSAMPLRDWANAATKVEQRMRDGCNAQLAGQRAEAIDHFLEAQKQLAFIFFWLSREGK